MRPLLLQETAVASKDRAREFVALDEALTGLPNSTSVKAKLSNCATSED